MEVPDLRSLRAADTPVVGGKAAGLGELTAIGLPVPPGVVLPARFLNGNDERALADLLPGLVRERGVRPPFAVRSSALCEDGEHASFAGQFHSELEVDEAGLAGAVVRCARSADAKNVQHYADALGVAPGLSGQHSVSVIVQEQVAADLSGVLFTADPLTGDPDTYVLEVVPGPGSALVGGTTEPLALRLGSDGVVVTTRPDWCDESFEARVLGLCLRLRELGRSVTEHRGSPQDIEFCTTADDTVVPVQARPITSLPALSARSFDLTFTPVCHATSDELGALARLDKVRLRLVAESCGLRVGRAWIIRAQASGSPRQEEPTALPPGLSDAPQISFVLQDPARLGGSIVRRFSAVGSRSHDLRETVQLVGASHDRFALIATEIHDAELSGVARRFGDHVVAEVGFGAFVPKGVVATSQYVCTTDGTIEHTEPVRQERAFLIEQGMPRAVTIGRTPTLTPEQCRMVCQAVEVANQYHTRPSVEFGVERDGSLFLIDFVEDGADDAGPRPEDLGIISSGRLAGRVVRVDDDRALELASLDSHFHTDRPGAAPAAVHDPVIVVAALPYLSLESFIRERDATSLGFVFRNCSYLSHLSIVLRELGVPALVDRQAYDRLRADDHVLLDTADRTVAQVPEAESTP
ncbi:PEP/pyruvate-binding domain-containing protein [Streptomyces sp. NPDC006617]|uniref:PEP/pyruvate-binding domain-containing protein n=1 Tax=Streptomyces sp. NPDC006617 TaxID=3155354 RepID=UPI0033B521FF